VEHPSFIISRERRHDMPQRLSAASNWWTKGRGSQCYGLRRWRRSEPPRRPLVRMDEEGGRGASAFMHHGEVRAEGTERRTSRRGSHMRSTPVVTVGKNSLAIRARLPVTLAGDAAPICARGRGSPRSGPHMEVSPNKKKKGRSVEWAGGEDFQPKRPSEGANGWAELNEVSPGAGLPFFFLSFLSST
jgi:hypothetical protein